MGDVMHMDRKAIVSLLVAAMLVIASFSVYVFVLDDDDDGPKDPVDVVPYRGDNEFQTVPYESYFLLYFETYEDVCYYTDDFFKWPSTAYDHSLALASCCFARTIFSSSDDWVNDKLYLNGEKFLEDIGFDSIVPNEDFLSPPELDTIGALIGKKTISCESENDTTLIALGLRGDGYGSEWASNMLVGDGSDTKGHHKGFYDSQTKVMDFLKGYITDQDITGDIKIWITGFSRAAAVSNITAGEIDTLLAKGERPFGDDVNLAKEDLYVYTMGTPAGVYYDGTDKYPDPHSEDYNNIRSFINYGDMVPKMMLKDCNFHRYGIDIVIPDMTQEGFEERKEFVVRNYDSVDFMPDMGTYYTDTFKPYKLDISKILKPNELISVDEDSGFTSFDHTLDFLFNGLSEKMGGREGFMEIFQEDVTEIFEIIGGESRSGLIEYFAKAIFPKFMEMEKTELLGLALAFVNGNDISAYIEDEIRETLISEGGYVDRAEELSDRLSDLLLNLRGLVWGDEELMNALATIVMNAETIVYAHNVETYQAWLRSMDPHYLP